MVRDGHKLSKILAARGEASLESILDSSDPKALVESMADQEAFYIYAELDEDGRTAFLRLVTGNQLDHLLDMDLWSDEELDPRRAALWIERLVRAGDQTVLDWMLRADSDLVVGVLQKLVAVHEGPSASGPDLLEARDRLPAFTLDGTYFVEFRNLEVADVVRRALVLLAGEDLEYYIALMQHVLSTSALEVEEEARTLRWRRLRDRGLVPPEEAYGIYRWPTKEELESLPTAAGPLPVDAGGPPVPTALALGVPDGLLRNALVAMGSSGEVDRVSREIATLGSLVAIADGLHLGEIEAHAQSLEKAMGYVAIGLYALCGGDPGRAAGILAETSVPLLFRAGYVRVAALGRRALLLRRKGWLSQVGLGLEVLDSPMGEVVRALAAARPRYAASALEGEPSDRDLREPRELVRCAEILDRVEALGQLFVDGLGMGVAPPEAFDLAGCVPSQRRELTLGLILRTALGRLALDGELRFVPVEAGRLAELARAVCDWPDPRESLGERALGRLRERLEAPSQGELGHVRDFVDECVSILVRDLGPLVGKKPVDPRLVACVVMRLA